MKKEYKELFQKIDDILWNDWDPIGLNDIEEVRDEYTSYVPYIVNLKMNGADIVKISKHLFKLESVTMGMIGNKEHCRFIAQKILDI